MTAPWLLPPRVAPTGMLPPVAEDEPTPPLPAAAIPPPLTSTGRVDGRHIVVPPEASVVARPPATLTVESVTIDMSPP